METTINLEERIGNHIYNGDFMGGIESPSKRNFLKKLGVGLVSLVGYATLCSSEANAQGLPPGIANCRDRAIRILYRDQVGEDRGRSSYGSINNRLNGVIGGFFDSVLVEDKSKRIEPALYLLREQINHKYRSGLGITVRLPEVRDVPQMLNFDRGIKNFYISYIYQWAGRYIPHEKSIGSEQTKRATESNFVHSIAYAAYSDTETAEQKAKEYLESDMEGKTRVVMDIKKQFEEMSNGDKESRDPRDPYNRKLAASWSSFRLERSIFFEQNGTDSDRNLSINRHIEIPLREAVGFRIRGPPHYKL